MATLQIRVVYDNDEPSKRIDHRLGSPLTLMQWEALRTIINNSMGGNYTGVSGPTGGVTVLNVHFRAEDVAKALTPIGEFRQFSLNGKETSDALHMEEVAADPHARLEDYQK
jgi:hypothetical protein